jgi:hypothetical protein
VPAVLTPPVVTVLIDGKPVTASIPAVLVAGTVAAPLDPYALLIARRVDSDQAAGRITFERDGKVFTIVLGSSLARSGASAEALPIAPYLRDGQPIIPLAALARSLGAAVSYQAPAHLLEIRLPPAAPIESMTPFSGPFSRAPAPNPSATLRPPAAATSPSGIPRPRRTPILLDEPP